MFQCGKSSVGDSIYRYMSGSGRFFPEKLLDCLNIASEHEAVQLADRVEASMYTWRRKACLSNSKNSWNMVKDLMSTTERTDKNYVMAERAETLLFCLKQRYPELSQTSLDICKIQYNKVKQTEVTEFDCNKYKSYLIETKCCLFASFWFVRMLGKQCWRAIQEYLKV